MQWGVEGCHPPVTTPATVGSSVPVLFLVSSGSFSICYDFGLWKQCIVEYQILNIKLNNFFFADDAKCFTEGQEGWRGPKWSHHHMFEDTIIMFDNEELWHNKNYYRCHNSSGGGVILGNLSSLAASHEPPPPPWFPSRGFPNEFLPKLQIQLLYPGYFEQWDWINVFTSLNFLNFGTGSTLCLLMRIN